VSELAEKRSHNSPLILILAVILLTPALFLESTIQMINIWIVNETFTHGFLIFPISIWLIYGQRKALYSLKISPEPKVLVLIGLLLTLWFLGDIVDVSVVQQLSTILLIPTFIWLLVGRKIVFTILFPLSYLLFAIPFGQVFIPPMMEFTADFTTSLIRAVGIPIYRDGLYFILPSGSWSVVEECSGVRYLIASMALGTLFAYLQYQSYKKRTLFIIAAIIFPIIANGLRAVGIVLIGHFSNMKYAVGADHLLYGWVFFGLVIFIMFYIGSFWADPLVTETASEVEQKNQTDKSTNKTVIVSLASALIIVGLFKTMSINLSQEPENLISSHDIEIADFFGGWQRFENRSIGWSPEFQNPDAKTHSSYQFGQDLVEIHIGYYQYQRQSAEAVSSQNRITDPISGDWRLTHASDLPLDDQYIKEHQVRKGDNNVLVWKWYRIGDLLTPNAYIAKFFDAFNQIFLARRDASMITISTSLNEDLSAARQRLRSFSSEAMPSIYQSLENLAAVSTTR
jgi:exosortase A